MNNAVADKNVCIYLGKEKTNPELQTKIAFVVSKKIHKRAVVRNRIKRLMRESFRLQLKEKKLDFINKYLSVICVAKPSAVDANFDDIDSSLKTLLLKKV